MATSSDSFLTGANIDFIEAQYARFLEDPTSVEPSWHALFGSLDHAGRPLIIDGLVLPPSRAPQVESRGQPARAESRATELTPAAPDSIGLQVRVDQTIIAFRLRGHLLAQLDPLGRPRRPLEHVADLPLVSDAVFTPAELDTLVGTMRAFDDARVPVRRVLERMRRTYCRHIGVECAQMYDSERRRWLQARMEGCENVTDFSLDEQRRVLTKLSEAEALETTIHTKFQAAKRFSVEGGDALLPMLDAFIETSAALGVREVVLGMAHRGRLNVLCNVLGKPAEELFSEFAGPSDPARYLNRGDVKYHLGYSSDRPTASGPVHVSLAFNPSHLGVVHPVVEGRTRAKQDRAGPGSQRLAVPLVIHGDAAFAGQGLVAETLNLSGLPAYDTGGTVHVVVNNQVGYTTDPEQGRTPLYCTAQGQVLDIPVFHVNGDDPEACVHVMRIAAEYRQRFHTDVVVDLVCYRRYGHNEGDEPAFTQPLMYAQIRRRETVRAVYAAQLAARGTVPVAESKAVLDACLARFSDAHARAKAENRVKDPSNLQGLWSRYSGGPDKGVPQVGTGLPRERLVALLGRLAATPEGFTLHPGVQRVLELRKKMARGEEPLDWGSAELLAWASLATEGVRVRLTGQDTERGTFAHRHAVLHDTKTGAMAYPLSELEPGQAPVLVVNSPLSELACLGFELGYSLDYPDALVAWEAQFGDFANSAQVVIDQFISAAEDKWRRLTGLVLLLPHGYEGAGPEHSSARPERFLELAAEDNLQLCYPTSAAQMFHLLRRQALRPIRKPLIVLTPKSLLRLPEAKSGLDELTHGTYRRLIAEPCASPGGVTRLLLCSGKVYFDLAKALATGERRPLSPWGEGQGEGQVTRLAGLLGRPPAQGQTQESTRHEASGVEAATVAIARLEQLYPLPDDELRALLASLPALEEVCWVQEEPRNGGAWRFMLEPLLALCAAHPARPRVRYAGRPETASPATGFPSTHGYEQRLLVEEALALDPKGGLPHVR